MMKSVLEAGGMAVVEVVWPSSSNASCTAHSSMCGGRSHLFDLGALNLTYYGASAWEVATVGPLPRGGVSMIMIDSDGTCERFDVGTVAPLGIGIVGLCRDFLQEELRCSSFFIEF